MFYKLKRCLISRIMCVVILYLCKQNIKYVLANIPKQLIQFAPRFHSDLMTGWRHIKTRYWRYCPVQFMLWVSSLWLKSSDFKNKFLFRSV